MNVSGRSGSSLLHFLQHGMPSSTPYGCSGCRGEQAVEGGGGGEVPESWVCSHFCDAAAIHGFQQTSSAAAALQETHQMHVCIDALVADLVRPQVEL